MLPIHWPHSRDQNFSPVQWWVKGKKQPHLQTSDLDHTQKPSQEWPQWDGRGVERKKKNGR